MLCQQFVNSLLSTFLGHQALHFHLKGGEKGYANPPFSFCPESEIRAKKIDESAIRNPGKNIFKIRQSVRLFTPLILVRK